MFTQFDPILMAEAVIVAVIILMQVIVFFRNRAAISQLKALYPSGSLLDVKSEEVLAEREGNSRQVLLLADHKRFSSIFREILRSSNAYLKRNLGLAEAEMLKDIASSRDRSVERAIDANIALPLYIGLLCTFTGVIIGLVKISIEGVSDAAIRSFVGGVLIGMIGSATGLALTVRSNYLFKNAKKVRDQGLYDFLAFLRAQILPVLKEGPTAQPEGALREDLAAFHEGFGAYQEHMQASLAETLGLLKEIKEVSRQVKNLEHNLDGVGRVLEENDRNLEKQAAFFDDYAKRAESFTRILSDHFATVDRKLAHMVDESIQALDEDMRSAYLKMDRYLASLEGDKSQEFVDGVNRNMASLQQDVAQLQQRSLEVSERLLRRIEGDEQVNKRISQQMEAMNANLKQVLLEQEAAKAHFTNTFPFKLFAISGSVAFILAIIGGIAYTITQIFEL